MGLEVTSIFPFFVVHALLLLCALAALRWVPFYARLIASENHRYVAIDGLRGFLALSVFFHHASVSYYRDLTGLWGHPESRFYAFLGPVSVALFFMITGFLFWSKVIASKGRLDPVSLYRSRYRRIVPMYLFALGCMLVVVAWVTGFKLQLPAAVVASTVVDWLTFGFAGFPDINGLAATATIVAAAFATLTSEWAFYLCLPALAPFHRPLAFTILATLGWLLLVLKFGQAYVLSFIAGMSTAMVVNYLELGTMLRGRTATVVALAALPALFLFCRGGMGHLPILLMSCFFVPLAHGNTLGGLLSSSAARMLGALSYSVYMLHGIVLYVAARVLPTAPLSGREYWLRTTLTSLVVVGVSSLTYRWIEHPFIDRFPKRGVQPDPALGRASLSTNKVSV